MAELTAATADHLGLPLSFAPEDFTVEDDYLGGGYGVIGDRERETIRLLARAERSDPVVSAAVWEREQAAAQDRDCSPGPEVADRSLAVCGIWGDSRRGPVESVGLKGLSRRRGWAFQERPGRACRFRPGVPERAAGEREPLPGGRGPWAHPV